MKAYKPAIERPLDVQRASIHGEADGTFIPKNANDYTSFGGMLEQAPGFKQLTNRNYSSFGNNTPLYLLDGVEINLDYFDLNSISPEQVSRIEFLKNAGTASIYGARSANGVIAIYTKKGGEHQQPERNSVATTVAGYATPREFYVPRYEVSETIPGPTGGTCCSGNRWARVARTDWLIWSSRSMM